MRALVLIVAVLAALYAGYWVVGSRAVERGAVAALADLETRGWLVDYNSLSTRGFPSRFDTSVSDLVLANPDRSLTWEVSFLQVLALSYQPNRLIAVVAPSQRITVDGVPVQVVSRLPMRASLHAGLTPDLPLRDVRVESGEVLVDIGRDLAIEAASALVAIREAPEGPGTYDLFVEAEGLGPRGDLAPLDVLRLDARVALDAPLDRRVRVAPGLLSVTLTEARLARGDLALSATGALAPDAEGFLAGRIVIVAENWRGMLALAREAGLLDEGRSELFERALEGLAEGEDRIEVPVTFEGGRVSALGLPLTNAPRLPQRQ